MLPNNLSKKLTGKYGNVFADEVCQAIRDYRIDESQLSIHPYGFFIIKVLTNKNFQVRLHFWFEGVKRKQNPDWPPHNHSFDIYSLVLQGELSHTIYDVRRSSLGKNTLYQVEYSADISLLKKTSTAISYSELETKKYGKNDTYSLCCEQFHSINHIGKGDAITLCVMTNNNNSTQYVLGDISGDQRYIFKRREVYKEERLQIIDAYKKLNLSSQL